jgi:hypothetical protein
MAGLRARDVCGGGWRGVKAAAIDSYIAQLEGALKRRGIEDPRTLEEARERLIDAVEEGLRQGLSIGDAEHIALERFGPPEAVAAQVVARKEGVMTRCSTAFETVWRRRTPQSAAAADRTESVRRQHGRNSQRTRTWCRAGHDTKTIDDRRPSTVDRRLSESPTAPRSGQTRAPTSGPRHRPPAHPPSRRQTASRRLP